MARPEIFVAMDLGTTQNDAQEHLREKYNFLVVSDLVKTTDDFIELAASESSLTGTSYQVRCDGNLIPSKQWLRTELNRLRSF